MAYEPYLGVIFMFAGNFNPRGYMFCQGQILSIAQNTALFSLLGTTYGGNGTTTFGLPDLRGRAPIGQGQGPGLSNRILGEVSGAESVTLLTSNLPAHNHLIQVNNAAGTQASPSGNFLAAPSSVTHPVPNLPGTSSLYATTANANLAATAVGATGNNIPVNNLQPYLGINFMIATEGLYPSRN